MECNNCRRTLEIGEPVIRVVIHAQKGTVGDEVIDITNDVVDAPRLLCQTCYGVALILGASSKPQIED